VHHDPRRSISYRNLDTSAGAPVATRGCPTSHLIGRRILREPRSTRMRSVPGGRLAPGRGAAGNLTRRLVGSLQGCLHPPGLWWMPKTPSACASAVEPNGPFAATRRRWSISGRTLSRFPWNGPATASSAVRPVRSARATRQPSPAL